jgi:hypothetical protein
MPLYTTKGGLPSKPYHKNSEMNSLMENNRPSYVTGSKSPSPIPGSGDNVYNVTQTSAFTMPKDLQQDKSSFYNGSVNNQY